MDLRTRNRDAQRKYRQQRKYDIKNLEEEISVYKKEIENLKKMIFEVDHLKNVCIEKYDNLETKQ